MTSPPASTPVSAAPPPEPPTNPFNPGFVRPRRAWPAATRHRRRGDRPARARTGPLRPQHRHRRSSRRRQDGAARPGILEQGARRNRWSRSSGTPADRWARSCPEHRSIVNDAYRGMLRRGCPPRQRRRRPTPGRSSAPSSHHRPTGRGQPVRLRDARAGYGRVADARHAVLVIAADELQAASPMTSKSCVAARWQLANVQRLPVALVGVESPATGRYPPRQREPGLRRTPRSDPHRQPRPGRHPKTPPSRRRSTSRPGHRPRCDDRMTAATHGYPYAIQVVGHACWDAARTTGRHARLRRPRLPSTRLTCSSAGFQPRWAALSPGDRQYLYVAAQLADDHGMVSSAAIASALGRTPNTSLANATASSTSTTCSNRSPRVMQFSVPGFTDWVQQHVARLRIEAGSPTPEVDGG